MSWTKRSPRRSERRLAQLTGASAVVIVHDMRTSSGPLAAAMARGVTSAGADVVDGGLGSTDMLYYGSGSLGLPGAMITASHNPARYNGIKLCRAGAKPIGQDTGLAELKQLAMRPRLHQGRDAGHDSLPGPAGRIRRVPE